MCVTGATPSYQPHPIRKVPCGQERSRQVALGINGIPAQAYPSRRFRSAALPHQAFGHSRGAIDAVGEVQISALDVESQDTVVELDALDGERGYRRNGTIKGVL